MNLKELILKLKLLLATLTLDDAKKREIDAQIVELERQAEAKVAPVKPEPAKPADAKTDATSPEIVALSDQVKSLTELVQKQEQRAVAAEKAVKDKAEADSKKRLADYEKKVVETEKKVSPAEYKEKWLPLLEANFDAASKIIDALPVHPASKTPSKPDDKKAEAKTGIMRSAPSSILNKVLEYSQTSEN